MTYVIRSMTTTDAPECAPYHCYLAWPEQRLNAWWTTYQSSAQRFATIGEAEAEWRRINIDRRGRVDIAPLHHPIPVWDAIHHQPEDRA